MEKYGFVYIWYDRKRKMYYIGCHWGTEDDGYICSSNRMRDAYRRRPHDFKRRIIQIIRSNRMELLSEEYKWLSLIDDKELGKRYYNHSKMHFGHWSSLPDRENIIEKIKKNANKVGRIKTPEEREKLSKSLTGRTRSIESRKKQSQFWKGKLQPKYLIDKRATSNRGKSKPKVECPKCGKIGGINAMKLHHFDNCGIKRVIIVTDEMRYRLRNKYEVTHPDGKIETVTGLVEFSKAHGINPSNLCQVAKGKKKQTKGYTCRKIED